jgi:hypothetical protein
MSKKQKTLIAVLAILAIALVGLSVGVIAKYVASIERTGSAGIARWAFTSDNSEATLSCDPSITYDADTLVGGKIAPGTTGTCEIILSNENTEVGVDYTITATISGKPTTLNLTHEGTAFNGGTITGTLTPGETDRSIAIDWEWPYYTSDANDTIDTAAGVGAGTLSINFAISGVQVAPAQ